MSEELSIAKEENTENKIVAEEPITAEPETENSTPNATASPESSDTHQTVRNQSNDSNDNFNFDEDEAPKKHFFHFHTKDNSFSRDQLILSRIKDEDLMDYLKLEQERLEFLQQAKEVKEKRLLTAFQLTISLTAIVAVTYLLKDNPTILISILYIVGIVAALNIWKNPRDKSKEKK